MTHRLAAALAALALTLLGATARAQVGIPCDDCARCTEALATAGARIALARDLEHQGPGACITVRGAGARLDGAGHALRVPDGAVGVRVEAREVQVRNVRVRGGAAGIELAQAQDATLFHDAVEGAAVGVRVVASPGARLVRCEVRGGAVGVAFGEPAGGRCPAGAVVRSPGAVVLRSRVEGADVGIAACDALPVLASNTLTGNGVGLVLGAPGRGTAAVEAANAPWDPCVCAPSLDGVRPATTVLYSSGCGGCVVHEGWLPALRAAGHDIRARESGPGRGRQSQRFDAYADRCAPELTDVLGVPGCVPNYACPATGEVGKVRSGENSFAVERSVSSQDDAASFARDCARAAGRRYRAGRRCVAQQLAGNTVCGNRTADIRAAPGAARFGGDDNACAAAEGWRDTGRQGCARPCPPAGATAPATTTTTTTPATATAPPTPVPPATTAAATADAAVAATPPTPAAPQPAAPAAADDAAGTGAAFAIGVALCVAVGAGLAMARRRRRADG